MSYVEHLAEEYLKKKGYLVTSRIRYQVPKGVSKKTVSGWHDVDLVAVNDKEALIIECRSYYREERVKDEAIKVKNNFTWANKYALKKMPLLRNKKKRWIYLADYLSPTLRNLLQKKGIEAVELKTWLIDFLKMLKKRYDATGGKVGKEDITNRILLCLIQHGLITQDTF